MMGNGSTPVCAVNDLAQPLDRASYLQLLSRGSGEGDATWDAANLDQMIDKMAAFGISRKRAHPVTVWGPGVVASCVHSTGGGKARI